MCNVFAKQFFSYGALISEKYYKLKCMVVHTSI